MTDYIVLLLGDTEAWWDTPEEEKKATYDVHGRFTEELERRGHTIVGGAELPRASEAKSLAPHSDTVTDGPYDRDHRAARWLLRGPHRRPRRPDGRLQDPLRHRRRRRGPPQDHRGRFERGGRVVKYLVLLIGDGAEKPWPDQTEDEQAAAMAKFGEFDAACRDARGRRAARGRGAERPARRHRDAYDVEARVALTDGPYAEVIEGMGGFYLLESPDLDVRRRAAALAAALRHPDPPDDRRDALSERPGRPRARSCDRSGAAWWPCSCRSSAGSTSSRTPSATRSRRPAGRGRSTAPPTTPPPG